jgi:hypothetical protein
MRTKLVNESIDDILVPKTEDELASAKAKVDVVMNKIRDEFKRRYDENPITDFHYFYYDDSINLTIEFERSISSDEQNLIDDILYPYPQQSSNEPSESDSFPYQPREDMPYTPDIEFVESNIVNVVLPLSIINEAFGGGGAGYAVYGGGGGGFGNPSLGGKFAGRGTGYGQGSSNFGGPNLMYTYEVKPLNQVLQQPPTNGDNEEPIHVGSKIKGNVVNSAKEIEGQVLAIEEDDDNNVKWYIVLDDEAIRQKVDPTTAYLVQPDVLIDPVMMDVVDESFYPSLIEEDFKSSIPFDVNPQELKHHPKYGAMFNSLSFAIILNALQSSLTPNVYTLGKIDLLKLYNFLKNKGYHYSFEKMKTDLLTAAPLLGITNYLKLSREEKSDLKFQERILSGDINVDYYDSLEIPKDQAVETDYVVRNAYGDCEPAFYRFDKPNDMHDINMIKAAFAIKCGNAEKSIWQNYMEARPAKVGHILKHGKSMEYTKGYGDFEGDVYENVNEGYVKHYMMELAQFVADNFWDLPEGIGMDELVDAKFPPEVYEFYLENKESIKLLADELM